MTPKIQINVFDLVDRWRLMLLQLDGEPPPPPSPLPGGLCERVSRASVAELVVTDGAAGRSPATMFQEFPGFSEVL